MNPVIDAAGLTVGRGGRTVLRELDFSVPAGAFIALVGANGAGKSTLFETLLGLLKPAAGRLSVLGREPRRVRSRIGFVPQAERLAHDGDFNGREFVTAAWRGHRWGLGWRRRQSTAAVDRALELVDAGDLARRRLAHLSGGQRRRLLIAQALVNRPRLLLMDEPLSQLDPANAERIVSLAATLRREQGIAVLFSTHDINPLAGLADRVLYLAGGRGRLGGIDEVVNDRVLSDLYGTPMHVARVRGQRLVIHDPVTAMATPEHGR